MIYAVYGTLRSGLGNHFLLKDCKKVSEEWTKDKFTMFDIGFPGIIEDDEGTPVKIEIYEVTDPQVESNIDALEGYNPKYPEEGLYNKKQIMTSVGKTWIYIWNGHYNYDTIESGDYKEHIYEGSVKE